MVVVSDWPKKNDPHPLINWERKYLAGFVQKIVGNSVKRDLSMERNVC